MSESSAKNQRHYRDALSRFSTGITVVTTKINDTIHGMTCNAFMSVSLDPPLVAIAVAHDAKMHQFIEQSGRYGVSILGAHQEHISNHFAGNPDEDLSDPFTEIELMPLITNANAHLITRVVDQYEVGDHTLFIGQVAYFNYEEESHPLLFAHGKYGRLGKNK